MLNNREPVPIVAVFAGKNTMWQNPIPFSKMTLGQDLQERLVCFYSSASHNRPVGARLMKAFDEIDNLRSAFEEEK